MKRVVRSLLVALALAALLVLSACGSSQQPQSSGTSSQPEASEAAPTTQSTGEASEPASAQEPSSSGADEFPKAEAKQTSTLVKKDIKAGSGAEATDGRTVTVHYTGWLLDGKKFDSSRDAGQPFQFVLGQGQVIPGWDQGVKGMKVGGKRVLVIPPDLGYGAQGAGSTIPPNSTLVFTVELLGVQ